jgi:hypothetical protein
MRKPSLTAEVYMGRKGARPGAAVAPNLYFGDQVGRQLGAPFHSPCRRSTLRDLADLIS